MIRLIGFRTAMITCAALALVLPGAHGINGDVFSDLIIGVPNETIGTTLSPGGIHAIYGSSAGLTDANNQFFTQGDLTPEDPSESFDEFGEEIICGDFNGDSYSDCAIGVPCENIGDMNNAGVVHVLYGSGHGFQLGNPVHQYISQDTPGVPGNVEESADFGDALAAGDFNHDGYDDLAIGAPGMSIGPLAGGGALFIFPGSASGLTTSDLQVFEQSDLGDGNPTEQYDGFSDELTVGDLNGDGFADLVIGSRNESIDEISDNQGCMHVMYGSASGLVTTGAQCFWQGMNPDVPGGPEAYDSFGGVLSTGDINADGFDDIAVSSQGEDIAEIGSNVGMVHIFFGSETGVLTTGVQAFFPLVDDGEFGQSLAMGDLNGDGFMDLIAGSTGFDVQGFNHSGAVYVYYGSAQGLDFSVDSVFHINDGFVQGTPADLDQFGYSVVSADFDGDGYWDIAASALSEDIESINGAGVVHILRGSATGITSTGAQTWTQDTGDIAETCETADFFGQTLAVSETRSQPSTCTETGVSIEMPGVLFHPGDTCGCTVTVCNAESTPIACPLFVILDVAGSYYFAPSFDTFDNYLAQYPTFAPGSMTITVLPEFSWPAGTGAFSGCVFYAALTDPAVTRLTGVMDSWTFGWAE